MSRVEMLEERLLGMLLVFPKKAKIVDKDLFTSPIIAKVFNGLQKSRKGKSSFDDFQKSLSPEQSMQVSLLVFKAEQEKENQDIDIKKEVKYCISQLRGEKLRRKLKEISFKIKEVEKGKNKVILETLTKEFNTVSKKLSGI